MGLRYPVVLATGKAKSGKDTVASFLVKDHGAVAIALADPMKRYGLRVFQFTKEQLWGPSQMRNGVDERYRDPRMWDEAYERSQWLESKKMISDLGLLPQDMTLNAHYQWFENLKAANPNGLSPRAMLQTFGTEFGRWLNPNVWINAGIKTAKTLLEEGGSYDPTVGHVPTTQNNSMVVITDGRFRNEMLAVKELGGSVLRVINPEGDVLAGEAGKHSSETEQDSVPSWWYDYSFENEKALGLGVLETKVGKLHWALTH